MVSDKRQQNLIGSSCNVGYPVAENSIKTPMVSTTKLQRHPTFSSEISWKGYTPTPRNIVQRTRAKLRSWLARHLLNPWWQAHSSDDPAYYGNTGLKFSWHPRAHASVYAVGLAVLYIAASILLGCFTLHMSPWMSGLCFSYLIANTGFIYVNWITTQRPHPLKSRHGDYRDFIVVNILVPILYFLSFSTYEPLFFGLPSQATDIEDTRPSYNLWSLLATSLHKLCDHVGLTIPTFASQSSFTSEIVEFGIVHGDPTTVPCRLGCFLLFSIVYFGGIHFTYAARAGIASNSFSERDLRRARISSVLGACMKFAIMAGFFFLHIEWCIRYQKLYTRIPIYATVLVLLTAITRLMRPQFYLHFHHYFGGVLLCACSPIQSVQFSIALMAFCWSQFIEGAARWSCAPLWHRKPSRNPSMAAFLERCPSFLTATVANAKDGCCSSTAAIIVAAAAARSGEGFRAWRRTFRKKHQKHGRVSVLARQASMPERSKHVRLCSWDMHSFESMLDEPRIRVGEESTAEPIRLRKALSYDENMHTCGMSCPPEEQTKLHHLGTGITEKRQLSAYLSNEMESGSIAMSSYANPGEPSRSGSASESESASDAIALKRIPAMSPSHCDSPLSIHDGRGLLHRGLREFCLPKIGQPGSPQHQTLNATPRMETSENQSCCDGSLNCIHHNKERQSSSNEGVYTIRKQRRSSFSNAETSIRRRTKRM